LGGTNLKGIIIDRNGSKRHLTKSPTQASRGGQQVLHNILSLISRLVKKEGKTDYILGVGIGTPGFIDEDGTILGGAENLPGWKGMQVFKPIKEQFGLDATGGNDVTVMALAESIFGAGKGYKNIACLALGTGIGGGIVTNGRLYKGTHGMAGELGHIVVQTDGLPCNCGQRGCVEQYASATGMVNLARMYSDKTGSREGLAGLVKREPDSITSKIIYDFVQKNDPVALLVHETACEMLARICGIVSNALSPDRIILGGGVMNSGSLILDEVVRRLPRHCWEDIAKRTEVVLARCSEDAGVLGAAALVFEDLAE
jgi:glucokinase